jgi:hypothetical protein
MTLEEFLAIPTLTPVPEGWVWIKGASTAPKVQWYLNELNGPEYYTAWCLWQQVLACHWAEDMGRRFGTLAEAKQWCHVAAMMGIEG